MNLPKISVVIPNYNYAKYVSRAIDSVLAQTYLNTEIVVVDDGSKDESHAILDGYGDRIKLLKQQNQGVSMARNSGVASSSGEFVAFLDADDIWLPEKLERQMQKFFDDEEIGLVHCSMTFIDPDDEVCGENRDGKQGWLATDIIRLKAGAVIGAGSTALVKRSVFEKVEGFDRRLTTAADWEFCYRVAVNHKIGFVEESLVLYRIHNSNMHNNVGAMEHDVSIGFEKAFVDKSSSIQKIRSECYGNFHQMLSGSYFAARDYKAFVRHAAKSLWYKPQNIGYYLSFPIRKLKKS